MNNRYNTLAVVNLLAFLGVLVFNYLSNSLPLNDKTIGELSDQYVNLFVPAGLTFSIWGIIYLVLAAWVGLQVIGLFSTKQREQAAPGVENAGWLFAITCVLNIAWIFAWHWEQLVLSILLMIALLVTLVALNEKTLNGRVKRNNTEKALPHTAFGIYQGWITVALIANVTSFLVDANWNRFGIPEVTWTIALILIGAGLAIYIVLSRNMIFHGLAVAWALLGIFIKRNDIGDAPTVQYMALSAMAMVLVAVALRFGRWRAY